MKLDRYDKLFREIREDLAEIKSDLRYFRWQNLKIIENELIFY
jgi:hypothetical protein